MLKNGIKSLKHLLKVSHSNPSSRMEFLLLERIWSEWSVAQVCWSSECASVTPLPREARGIVEQDRIGRHSTKRTFIAHTSGIHSAF